MHICKCAAVVIVSDYIDVHTISGELELYMSVMRYPFHGESNLEIDHFHLETGIVYFFYLFTVMYF